MRWRTLRISFEYHELDDAIMDEMWKGNRTHAGLMDALAHMAERYTYRGEGNVPIAWGEIISRRIASMRNRDMLRSAAGPGWVPVPAHLRKPKARKPKRW